MIVWILLLILAAAAAFGVGYWLRTQQGRSALTSAEQKAKQVIEEAKRQAESVGKNAQLEAKEQMH